MRQVLAVKVRNMKIVYSYLSQYPRIPECTHSVLFCGFGSASTQHKLGRNQNRSIRGGSPFPAIGGRNWSAEGPGGTHLLL